MDEKFENQLLELIAYYHNRACTCAFPRFRKLIGLSLPAIILEKEALIKLGRLNYDVEEFSERTDKYEYWTCKTCDSTFYTNFKPLHILPGRWEDSTQVNRHQLNCTDIGEDAETLIPLCLPTLPRIEPVDVVRTVTKEAFIQYMREVK